MYVEGMQRRERLKKRWGVIKSDMRREIKLSRNGGLGWPVNKIIVREGEDKEELRFLSL